MVEVGSCIASKPLGSLGGGSGMLQFPGCPLAVSLVLVPSREEEDLLVAARSSGLPVGGAKYRPD
jgi:hypothetical protein